MKIVFFGTPEFVIPVAEALHKNFELVAVVTAPNKPAGRKQLLVPSPIKIWAEKTKITVLEVQQFNNLAIQQLSSLNPDLFVVAAYGKIIPQQILEIPKLGAINIHPSELPYFRGPSPIQASILAGLKRSKVTLIKIDEQMDHGPIITTLPFSFKPTDTFTSAVQMAFQLAADNISSAIQKFSNSKIQSQDHSKATYCSHISKEDGLIDLDNPPSPEVFDRMVRAYYPWPGVWAITRYKMKDIRLKYFPGNKIQVEGKKPVDLETFYRGYPELKSKIEKLYSK